MSTKTIYSTAYRALIDEVRRLREASGKTQSDFARALGWPQQRLSAVETCARRLDILEFFLLAETLGLSPEQALKLVVRAKRKG